jgi:hypothetical protein
MNSIQKVGGYAALIAGLLYAAIVVIELGVMAPQGLGEMDIPADKVLAVAVRSNTPFLLEYLSSVMLGITLVLPALALRERLRAGAPNRMQMAVIAATVASALFLAHGITAFEGFPPIVAANDLTAYRILGTVTQGLLSAAIFAIGWTALLWGWAGLSTKGLPAVLGYVLLLAGVFDTLAIVIHIFEPLGAVLNMVWAFWLGYVLLMQTQTMAAQPKATM